LQRGLFTLTLVAVFSSRSSITEGGPEAQLVLPKPQPIQVLPAQVTAAEDRLSLYANFRSNGREMIPLYIVNRISRKVTLPVQDGNFLIKLEANSGGKWERAQLHSFSDCGFSYRNVTLAPNTFRVTWIWYPRQGESAQMRYRSYGGVDLVSNVALGWFEPRERDKARYDQLAVRRGNAELVRSVLSLYKHIAWDL
jgi:hypothetical protein